MIFYFYIFNFIFAQKDIECFSLSCHPTTATISLNSDCPFLNQIPETREGEWETFFYLGSVTSSDLDQQCAFHKNKRELNISYGNCGFKQNIADGKLIYQVQIYYGNHFLGISCINYAA